MCAHICGIVGIRVGGPWVCAYGGEICKCGAWDTYCRHGSRDMRGVCVVFVYVLGGEMWTCEYGYICIGWGNIGLCLHGEGEGHMCVCGCWSE